MASRWVVSTHVGLAVAAMAGLAAAGACDNDVVRHHGDDDDTDAGQGGAATTSSNTWTTTTTTTTGPDGGDQCLAACTDLYTCTQQPGLCPGLEGTTLNDWLYGTTTEGCLDTCADSPALAALVDPTDCPGTVSTLSTLSPNFEAACSGSPDGGAQP